LWAGVTKLSFGRPDPMALFSSKRGALEQRGYGGSRRSHLFSWKPCIGDAAAPKAAVP
jgi:hypothetical protein